MVQFKSFAILVSLVTAVSASTVANVLTDVSTISSDVTTLKSNINAFTATTQLGTAESILAESISLVSVINSATTDVNNVTPLPVSESDGQSILNAITALEPNIIAALQAIGTTAKRALFAGLPIQNVVPSVHTDLTNLKTATDAFGAALIVKAPSDLQSEASTLLANIDAAFASAIAVYA